MGWLMTFGALWFLLLIGGWLAFDPAKASPTNPSTSGKPQ